MLSKTLTNSNPQIVVVVLLLLSFGFDSFCQIPLAHYNFNGNTNDLSGNSNDIVTNTATYNNNGAYSFDGVDDYMIVPSLGPFTEFTLIARVKFSSTGLRNLFSGTGAAWYPSVFNGDIRWYDGVNWRVSTSKSLNDDQWHNIAYVFDDGTFKIFVDGAFQYQDAQGSHTEGLITTIGSINYHNQRFFMGEIDMVKIYSNALSQSEINTSFGTQNTVITSCDFLECDSDVFINGNVGIGLTNPDEKLVVDGKIRSEEVKVEIINGPDYVFEEDYDLRTLEETKAYIVANKHLPEIPSAKEMEANGVELGDMNMRLLKKIEELTLYQIELLEKVEELQDKVKRLEEN